MYSVVMLAAMTAAPETPDFFFKNKFRSQGCHGYSCGGCYGGCTGCTGYSCGGCFGGCGGCWSSGHSCHGYASAYSSCSGYGTVSCYGGYAFSGCTGCTGCVGSTCCGGFAGYYSPYMGSSNPAPMHFGNVNTYYAPINPAEATGVPEAVGAMPTDKAQLVVRVPADSKLYADGHATSLAGVERSFYTPEITPGKDYKYTLKVEFNDNGEVRSETKQVTVRAGHRTVVALGETVDVSKTTSPVTVNLPSNSKLYVDGVATATTAGTQTFRTPELPKGKLFTYQFQAEVVVDGKVDVRNRSVTFRAGEAINIDFSEKSTDRTASRE